MNTMEELPTTPIPPLLLEHNEIELNAKRAAHTHRVGVLSLVLIFIASVLFTTAYLQSAAMPANVGSAQTAAAMRPTSTQKPPIAFSSSTIKAHAAYVLDTTDGRVLYSLNPDAQLPLASITKVMMALVVSEALSPDTYISIPHDTAPPGNIERLAQGDVWRTGDMIDFTLAASSNEGAEILAQSADAILHERYPKSPAGSATLWRMNDLAAELHLAHTYFLNVSGLDESATQAGAFGSAHDVAALFAYALSTTPETFAATTQASFARTSVNGSRVVAINTDKALDSIPGIIMGKTGYTDLAGGNLAVAFRTTSGHTIVAVVLGSTEPGRFEDMKKIVEAVEQTLHKAPSSASTK